MTARQASLSSALVVMFFFGSTLGAAAQSPAYFGLLTPHLGVTSGGDAEDVSLTPGLSVAVFESGGWGAEADIGYVRGFDSLRFEESSATTYMVNATWTTGRRSPRVKPFGAGGLGLIHTRTCVEPCGDTASYVDFGMNVGGGVMLAVGEIFFVRGDLRYFRSLQDHPELGLKDGGPTQFWRTSIGFSVWWPVW